MAKINAAALAKLLGVVKFPAGMQDVVNFLLDSLDAMQNGQKIDRTKLKEFNLPNGVQDALDFLLDKVEEKLEYETTDRAAFEEELGTMSDDELQKLFVPDVYQKTIYDIDYEKLKESGIKLISFDIDDTITDSFVNKFKGFLKGKVPGARVTMPKKAKELVQELHDKGFAVELLTNTRATIAEDVKDALKADGYIARAHKPGTEGFERLLEKYKLDKSQMAHVGNSISADVRGGNQAGVTTCLVRRAGVSMKAGKLLMDQVNIKTKGHLIRKELKNYDIWRKHHLNTKGDQYYQLGETQQP